MKIPALVTSGRLTWRRLVGLVLIPVLVVAGLLGATWNSNVRLRTVQAAVVNLDQAVTLNGQVVPMGRQLSAALVDSNREQNFTWVLADQAHAEAGLRDGSYAAVVTIPANFSAAATSFGGAADKARQATIDVRTLEAAGIADTALGQSIAKAAAATLNRTLTTTYLDNIYLGFNQMGDQFAQLADAAAKFATGTADLSAGLDALAKGQRQLADGMGQLSDGSGQLVGGADQLAGGIRQLDAQVPALVSGSSQLAGGAAQLRDGLSGYTQGTTTLAQSTQQQLDLFVQIRSLVDQVEALTGQTADLAAFVPQLNAAIDSLTAILGQAQTATSALQTGLGDVQGSVGAALDQAVAQAATCPPQIEALGAGACGGYLAGAKAAAQTGKAAVAQALAVKDPATGLTLQQTAKALAARLAAVDDSALATKVAQLQTLLQSVKPLLSTLSSTQLPTTAELAAQRVQLQQLIDAGPAIMVGANGVASGSKQLADGMPALKSGTGQLAYGAGQLASGVRQYTDGVAQSAAGADALASGLEKTAAGTPALADGLRQFADGLAKGKDQVPHYTSAERANLAQVVASPIAIGGLDPLIVPGLAWASLLATLALWLGALATYVVLPAVNKRLLLSSRSTARELARSVLPGLAVMGLQVVAVTAVLQLALRLPLGVLAGVFGVLLVAGVAFVLVNQALVSWLRGAGRVVSVVLAVVTAAAALTSSAPGWLAGFADLSPVTPALGAIRRLVIGLPTAGDVFLLLGWAAVAALAIAAAVVSARTVRAASLVAAAA